MKQRFDRSTNFNSPLSTGDERRGAARPAVCRPAGTAVAASRTGGWARSLKLRGAFCLPLLLGSPVLAAASTLPGQPPGAAADKLHHACHDLTLLGVNLAGAEFTPTHLPGKAGRDFTYPSAAEIAYYAGHGLNLIRLPLLWERLQPREFGPLDPAVVHAVQSVVRDAARHGMKVDLDVHNYGIGFGHPIGSDATPDRAFADLWRRVAQDFRTDRNVMFGLMNEPHVQNPTAWVQALNEAIKAIRATGARQEILVSGTDWDGAWHWESSGNAAAMQAGLIPDKHVVFEVHQYLDEDGSGTHWNVVSPMIGVQRLQAVTDWAKRHGDKLFLGEFGVAADPASLQALDNMLAFMCAHASVWQGGAYWSGGAWWHDYPFSIEPKAGHDPPQMRILSRYAPAR